MWLDLATLLLCIQSSGGQHIRPETRCFQCSVSYFAKSTKWGCVLGRNPPLQGTELFQCRVFFFWRPPTHGSQVLLIVSKAGEKEFASCHVELQVSDSIVALATTHKMSSSKLAFNFLGAEVAIQCEKIGIEGLKCSHIPGAANVVADFLSRPDRMAKEEFCTWTQRSPSA